MYSQDRHCCPKVGIIIINWNRGPDTLQCLESVEALSYSNRQIYIVDNHSQDGSPEILRVLEKEAEIKLICNSQNLGFTGINNLAMKAAIQDGCDYLWLLNNKVIVDSQSLSLLVRRVQNEADRDLISPLLYEFENPESTVPCGFRIQWSREWIDVSSSHGQAEAWQEESPDRFLLNGTALLLSRRAAIDVGDFDNDFFGHGANRDYCFRASKLGFKTTIELDAKVFLTQWSTRKSPHWYYYLCRNQYRFWVKHQPQKGIISHVWNYRVYWNHLADRGGKERANRFAMFEGLLDALLNKKGERISGRFSGKFARLMARISHFPFIENLVFGRLDRWNIKGRIRPWKTRHMRPIDFFFTRMIRRIGLLFHSPPVNGVGDITVIIPLRNLFNYRLLNTLNSIKAQDYPKHLIKVVLVDYGSEPEFSDSYSETAISFGAEYLHVKGPQVWNLSHATNIALRKISSEYVLCTGMDLMLSPNFLSQGISQLQKNPRQIVLSTSLFSTPGLISGYLPDVDMLALRSSCDPMYRPETWPHTMATGVNMGLRSYYEKVRGYDERFILWGYEDDDLLKRMELSGLKVGTMNECAFFIHQYHLVEKPLDPKKYERARQANHIIHENDHNIIRNSSDWGTMKQDYSASQSK